MCEIATLNLSTALSYWYWL